MSIWAHKSAAIAATALVLMSCRTAPVVLDAYDGCNVAPNVWREIPSPAEREALFDLPEKVSARPVREHFYAAEGQREVWFEDAARNLQACIYNPTTSCYGGGRRLVVFTRLESSWEAG